MKQVIHIFGASGSGTSTLGRKIRDELGYRFIDTDDYLWLPTDPPFTDKRDVDERIRMMEEEIGKEGDIVVAGSLVGWGDVLIPHFTLAVRLICDTEIRLKRIRMREHMLYGSRIDPGGDMYRSHLAFLEWADAYDEGSPTEMRSRRRHDAWQEQLHCPLLILDGADDLERKFGAVERAIRSIEKMENGD